MRTMQVVDVMSDQIFSLARSKGIQTDRGKSYRVKIKVRIEVLSNNRALAIINAETVYTDK